MSNKFNYNDLILVIAVLFSLYVYFQWYVGNADYTEQYAECLIAQHADDPNQSMDRIRKKCDDIVNNKEKAQ